MKNILFILLIALSPYASAGGYPSANTLADGGDDVSTLTIGDAMPDVMLSHVMHHEKSALPLSAFRGKLVILDFWRIGCSPCIASMPKMQQLQDKYQDRLQVLLVTEDSEERVKALFSRLSRLQGVHLPTVVDDKVLHPLFAFRTVPTHVWISEEGEVLQITSGANTVEDKIEEYFAGKQVALPVRQQHKDFNYKEPLWMEGDGRQVKYLEYYSYIMRYVPDAGGLTGVNRDPNTGKNVRIIATNQSLMELFKLAYGQQSISLTNPFHQDSRVLLKVEVPERFFYPKEKDKKAAWLEDNVYCYELIVPPDKSPHLFEFMQQDLARYFNIIGRVEQQMRDCLVLRRTSGEDLLATRGGQFRYSTNYGERLEMTNMPVEWLINTLQTYLDGLGIPIVDDTGYEGNIDMKLNVPLRDPEALKEALRAYDLKLVREKREVSILVLEEISSNE